MKKVQTKIAALVAGLILLSSLLLMPVSAANIGDVIGFSQPTDIVATINGYQLTSYNVNDYTYICVEDLQYYGFNVAFDMNSRTLSLDRNPQITEIDPQNSNPDFRTIGIRQQRHDILHTDIVTYAGRDVVEGSNINGKTIINFEELARFGTVSYDNDKREISLVIDGLNTNAFLSIAEALQEYQEYNSIWDIRYRAKGDILVLVATARMYASPEEQQFFKENIIPDDRKDTQTALDLFRENGIPFSAIQVEYRNFDRSLITFYEVK